MMCSMQQAVEISVKKRILFENASLALFSIYNLAFLSVTVCGTG